MQCPHLLPPSFSQRVDDELEYFAQLNVAGVVTNGKLDVEQLEIRLGDATFNERTASYFLHPLLVAAVRVLKVSWGWSTHAPCSSVC